MSDDIEKLKIFCTAAQSPSFKQAAIKLKTSPQAVTRAIKDLEAKFNEIIFIRSTRNIQITQFGETLYKKSWPAIVELTNVFQTTLKEDIPVRITVPSLICSHFIMPLMPKIKELDNALT
ncbi:LysR family transcriptional regulator [Celerinatantimonas sp. MCCC 1A17872]|uniref:LysR family transcriptional regulator n=1 Tax=Celerinatantimonas sp. MCCC 1A17872 TaxID=3177514 RepID=UPI0038C2A023